MKLAEMSQPQVQEIYSQAESAYAAFKQRGVKLNMSRGKPGPEQLEVTRDMHSTVCDFCDSDGDDVRNVKSYYSYFSCFGCKCKANL